MCISYRLHHQGAALSKLVFTAPPTQQHVQDGRKEAVDGYVKTFSKALPPDGDGGVYALDCEMVS